MARLQPTVQDAQGNTLVLDPKDVPDTMTLGTVRQQLTARGYRVVKIDRLPDVAPAAAPEAGGGLVERLIRAAPATAGMIRGGALGGEAGGAVGGPLGAAAGGVLGAGLGAGGMEAAYGGLQRLFGMRGGEASIPARAGQAAKAGAMGELGIRGIGALGRGAFGLGRAGLRAMRPAAETEAIGFGGVREAAITSELMDQLAVRGGSKDAITFARQVRPALRQMLRDTEKSFKTGGAAQRQALEPQLQSLRGLVGRTMSLAPIAQAVAKDPVLLADLVRKNGSAFLPELQSAWLTAALSTATGRAGLNRGLLNIETLQTLFEGLGKEGQKTLFSRSAPELRRLFQAIEETGGAPAGELAERETAGHSALPQVVQYLLRGAGGGLGVEQALHGHPVMGGIVAATPWVMGRLMSNREGIEWLTRTAVAMRDSRMFQDVAPALAREGVQLLGGTGEAAPRMPSRLGLQAPVTAP